MQWGHLSTLHSWLGLLFLCVYSLNFAGGAVSFLLPQVPADFRASYTPSHRFIGIVTLLLAAGEIYVRRCTFSRPTFILSLFFLNQDHLIRNKANHKINSYLAYF